MAHVLVICARRFNPGEMWAALLELTTAGHTYDIASTASTIIDEDTGIPYSATVDVNTVAPATVGTSYKGVMLISGHPEDSGAYWNHKNVLALFECAHAQGLPIASICSSVPVLRKLVAGYKVTCYPIIKNRQALIDAGAIYTPVAVCVDRNIVTAEHQMAATIWAKAFCDLLDGKTPQVEFTPTPYMPKGRERRVKPEVMGALAALRRQQDDTV